MILIKNQKGTRYQKRNFENLYLKLFHWTGTGLFFPPLLRMSLSPLPCTRSILVRQVHSSLLEWRFKVGFNLRFNLLSFQDKFFKEFAFITRYMSKCLSLVTVNSSPYTKRELPSELMIPTFAVKVQMCNTDSSTRWLVEITSLQQKMTAKPH